MLIVGGTLLGLAGWLQPDPTGMGTHCQLGFAGCPLPMLTGLPCPSCGMTTAFAHTVRGEWASAFLAQPAGFLLALTTVTCTMMGAISLVTGRGWRLNGHRVRPHLMVVGVVGLILGGWGFKLVYVWMFGTI